MPRAPRSADLTDRSSLAVAANAVWLRRRSASATRSNSSSGMSIISVAASLRRYRSGPQAKFPCARGQQVPLQPGLVVAQRSDDCRVDALEFSLQGPVLHVCECFYRGRPEKILVAVELLDGDFHVDTGHVRQVAACFGKGGRHRLFARDQAAQALGSRREVALDQLIRRTRDAAAVNVRVTRPGPDFRGVQPAGLEVTQQHFAVMTVDLLQAGRIDGFRARP